MPENQGLKIKECVYEESNYDYDITGGNSHIIRPSTTKARPSTNLHGERRGLLNQSVNLSCNSSVMGSESPNYNFNKYMERFRKKHVNDGISESTQMQNKFAITAMNKIELQLK